MAQFKALPDGRLINVDRLVELSVVTNAARFDVVAYTDGVESGAQASTRRRVVTHPGHATRTEATAAMYALVGLDPPAP